MYAICLYYTKNKMEAEDLLHDGFIKVFKNISQLKDVNMIEFWMRRIFVNCALAKYRKQNLLHFEINLPEPDTHFHYENAINNLTAQELIQLIKSLSPQYQIVFNLYAIEGFSHKEISEMLNISESTSKSNLSRARAILQEKIEIRYGECRKVYSLAK